MVRQQYEKYSYVDPENIYTYPNSMVLKNRFNEKDEKLARELEYNIVASQTIKLFVSPILVNNVSDILAIHRFLFDEIYEWAGEFRRVNISKNGNAFLPIQSFGSASDYLNLLIYNYHKNNKTRDEIVFSLAEILDNLNYFHPFREGNGRTQREVIRSLALMKGYECEISIGINDEVYNLYMDGTVYGDIDKLRKLISSILVEIE